MVKQTVELFRRSGISLFEPAGQVIISALEMSGKAEIPIEWQIEIVFYEMNASYRKGRHPQELAVGDSVSWPALVLASEHLKCSERRQAVLAAALLYAEGATAEQALRVLASSCTEEVLRYVPSERESGRVQTLRRLGKDAYSKTLVGVPAGPFIYGNTPEEQAEELRRVSRFRGARP